MNAHRVQAKRRRLDIDDAPNDSRTESPTRRSRRLAAARESKEEEKSSSVCSDSESDVDEENEEEEEDETVSDKQRFVPTDEIRKAWETHPGNPKRLSLEEAAPRNIKPLNEQHKIKKGKKTYFAALNYFWDYLEDRGLYSEMIILLQDPVAPREAGSFTPEVLLEFCLYMSVLYIGQPHVTFGDSKPLVDKNGRQMYCVGTYASRSALNNFRSGVTKVLESLGHKQQSFYYAGENGNPVNVGHSFMQSTVRDEFSHLKHETMKLNKEKSREPLTPDEVEALLEYFLQLNTVIGFQMYVMCVLAFVCCFRFHDLENLCFRSVRESLTRISVHGVLKCIGLGFFGKMEDKEVDDDAKDIGHLRAVWLNNVNQFFCAMTALLLWITFLHRKGVDISDAEGSIFCLSPGFVAKLGKCKLKMEGGRFQERFLVVSRSLLTHLFCRAKKATV